VRLARSLPGRAAQASSAVAARYGVAAVVSVAEQHGRRRACLDDADVEVELPGPACGGRR